MGTLRKAAIVLNYNNMVMSPRLENLPNLNILFMVLMLKYEKYDNWQIIILVICFQQHFIYY